MSARTITVPEESAGARLDRFLASVLGDQSRSQIQRLIKEGRIRVGDREAKPNQAIKVGQAISIDIPAPVDPTPQPEPLPLRILYQDRDVIVIDKPAGMVVHPAAGHEGGTLVNALLHHVTDLSGIGGEKRPGIVHRLDRGTSGLMVVAKNDRAHEALARQFRDREVEKEYAALVWGEVMAGHRIDAPIGRDPANRKRMSAKARRSREAVTRIVRADHLGRALTLVRVAIYTGRTHQIRVHLSAIGHPIVGDKIYGPDERLYLQFIETGWTAELAQRLLLPRHALHSAKLATEGECEWNSLLPPDLAEFCSGGL